MSDNKPSELKPSALGVLSMLLHGSMTAVDFVTAHVLDYRKMASELNAHFGPGTIISRKVPGHPYYRYEISSDAALCRCCGEKTKPPAIICEHCGRERARQDDAAEQYHRAYDEGRVR